MHEAYPNSICFQKGILICSYFQGMQKPSTLEVSLFPSPQLLTQDNLQPVSKALS